MVSFVGDIVMIVWKCIFTLEKWWSRVIEWILLRKKELLACELTLALLAEHCHVKKTGSRHMQTHLRLIHLRVFWVGVVMYLGIKADIFNSSALSGLPDNVIKLQLAYLLPFVGDQRSKAAAEKCTRAGSESSLTSPCFWFQTGADLVGRAADYMENVVFLWLSLTKYTVINAEALSSEAVANMLGSTLDPLLPEMKIVGVDFWMDLEWRRGKEERCCIHGSLKYSELWRRYVWHCAFASQLCWKTGTKSKDIATEAHARQ